MVKMAKAASMAKYNAMQRKLLTMQKRAKRIREVADDKVQFAVRIATSGAAAGLAGYYNGLREKKLGPNAGPWKLFGMPAELLLGAAAHAAGLANVGGDMSQHMHSFGDGLLSVGVYKMAMNMGLDHDKGWAGLKGDSSYKSLQGQRLTDEELEALAR
jgi:hypothetical protein